MKYIKMKYIANIITIIRIPLAISLLFIEPMSATFLVIYTICCISDVADGYIARKTKTKSNFGAKIDTIADFIFVIIVFIRLIPTIHLPIWILIWIGIIFVLRFISISIVFIKYHTFAILHTYLNKLVGLVLIFVPILMYVMDISMLSIIVCTIASLSAIEEISINIKSSELNRDTKSLFT